MHVTKSAPNPAWLLGPEIGKVGSGGLLPVGQGGGHRPQGETESVDSDFLSSPSLNLQEPPYLWTAGLSVHVMEGKC